MVDQVDHHRNAEGVREQNELLPLVAAHAAGFGQDLDRLKPFRFGQLDLLDKGMQVLDRGASMICRSRGSGVCSKRCSASAVMSALGLVALHCAIPIPAQHCINSMLTPSGAAT